MIEIINPYTIKIIIAARDGDSVRAISKRINLSYGWTYKWVEELVGLGVFKRKGQKIKVNKKNPIYNEFVGFIRRILKEKLSLSDAYALPNLAGLDYAFTATDAVFIWTKGGYNIGRYKDNYPLFIEILDQDFEKWKTFFNELSIKSTKKIERKKGIYFILQPRKVIKKEIVEGVWVMPLDETVAYAQKYIYNFEPALEMLSQMYNLNKKVKYAEKSHL